MINIYRMAQLLHHSVNDSKFSTIFPPATMQLPASIIDNITISNNQPTNMQTQLLSVPLVQHPIFDNIHHSNETQRENEIDNDSEISESQSRFTIN